MVKGGVGVQFPHLFFSKSQIKQIQIKKRAFMLSLYL